MIRTVEKVEAYLNKQLEHPLECIENLHMEPKHVSILLTDIKGLKMVRKVPTDILQIQDLLNLQIIEDTFKQ